jgi:NAD+ diphosphatase
MYCLPKKKIISGGKKNKLMTSNPANHFKYCPRCAARGNFDEKEKAFKCHSCGFHFFLNSSTAVTAIIFDWNERLLMVRRGIEPHYGKLDFPGGFVDPGESAEQAMIREIKEELDLVPDKISYWGSFPNEYLYSGTIVNTTDIVFKCIISDFSKLKHLDDVMDFEFVNVSEVDVKQLPFLSVQNIIKRLQDEQD